MSDLISRQILKQAMYHEAFEVDSELQKWDGGCWIRYKLFEKIVDSMPSVQPNPEKDRQESKDYCAECDHVEMCNWYPHDGCEFRQIQPEQETGQWGIAIGYDPKRRFVCDQCARMAYEPSKYCPNCGAKMEE